LFTKNAILHILYEVQPLLMTLFQSKSVADYSMCTVGTWL